MHRAIKRQRCIVALAWLGRPVAPTTAQGMQLKLQPTSMQSPGDGSLLVGMVRGNKRTQMLCLRVVQGHLTLIAGMSGLPLTCAIRPAP